MSEKSLVIVESPTKAKTITKFLGRDYEVVSSMGHIRDLPKSKVGVDETKNFVLTYEIPSKAKKTVTSLKQKAKTSKEVILATDEDREGEAIAFHLAHVLKLNTKTTKRIVFHEITKPAIEEAIKTPRHLDENLFDAQQARRALDRVVGYTLSPFLWHKIRFGLSAGRVQSVALRLVVEREREIEAFGAQEFWSIEGLFLTVDKAEVKAQLAKIATKKLDKFAFKNKLEADTILAEVQKEKYAVVSVVSKKTKKHPYPPFITSSLQQDAAHRLGFSAKQTMMLAQQLYEGINLGSKGHQGLITYMRTDSTNISPLAIDQTRKFITSEFGQNYLSDSVRVFKTKSKSAQEAHEAIRPTESAIKPEDVKQYLDPKQYKLYKLIWSRFVATQMAPAVFDSTSVDIADENNKFVFKATGKVKEFDGFLRVYDISSDDVLLPVLKQKDRLETKKIDGEQHFTEPPARFDESSLVKILEEHEIGRPSTYASIISTIQDRGYVTKNDQKRFVPTEIGTVVNDMLVEHFPSIVDVAFTAKEEQKFDDIAEGQESYEQMMKEFYYPFIAKVADKEKAVKKYVKTLEGKFCPECGKALVEKIGRFGNFYTCSAYPECKYIEDTDEDKKFEKQFSEEVCEKCGAQMEVKRGKWGPFLGCSNYPTCKNIRKIEEKLGEKCPDCQEGDLVWKKGKRGKFVACNRYPDCKFTRRK
jgi:DNA topoisomerase-1